jgi:hypothetical protein
MNTFKHALGAMAAVMALASAATIMAPLESAAEETEMKMPSTAADHTAEAAKYDREARELDGKAEHHAEMAKHYQSRYSGGGKQATTLLSLTNHCERLSKVYREAAAEARELSKSHLAMAKSG